ncbi:hypothetical protein V5735_07055 (plasmid) [Haladaptatus sp. SPP-AMP-3]|uniref:hypothetical protein n=1 Tax=Haladaptatus sp. SPP-AMP-3 TaxID=3121295 RepID=UPI003C2BAA7E
MVTAVRTLDEGAWVNVNNTRIVGVSDIWRLADHEVCDCDVALFLVEVFTDIGVDGAWVEARAAGQCIGCGERDTTGWLRIGRPARWNDEFRAVDPGGVHRPSKTRGRD